MTVPPGRPRGSLSPDGRWWWDGVRWQPVPAAPFPGPAPARSTTGRTVAIVVCSALVVAGLGIAGMVALGARTVAVQQNRVDETQIRTALHDAAVGMETYAVEHSGQFPANTGVLEDDGFEAPVGIDVTVISPGTAGVYASYCLAGAPAGAEPTHWFTDEGVTTTPCD